VCRVIVYTRYCADSLYLVDVIDIVEAVGAEMALDQVTNIMDGGALEDATEINNHIEGAFLSLLSHLSSLGSLLTLVSSRSILTLKDCLENHQFILSTFLDKGGRHKFYDNILVLTLKAREPLLEL
jgi:hypothetical protein